MGPSVPHRRRRPPAAPVGAGPVGAGPVVAGPIVAGPIVAGPIVAGPIVAADWSGAATGERRHLWLAEWQPAAAAVVGVAPTTRTGAAERVLALAEADDRLLAGFDFSFSLPEWWLRSSGITSVSELWADGARLERWLAECAPPFWGRPGRRRPVPPAAGCPELRRTEVAACRAALPHRPKSTFQVGGAGAVGTASLRGMPVLSRLRRAGMAVWPFHAAGAGPVVTEVWPRLATGSVVKSRSDARLRWLKSRRHLLAPAVLARAAASADAFDAVAAALQLAQWGTLPLVDVTDPTVVLEGWIYGVPFPGK